MITGTLFLLTLSNASADDAVFLTQENATAAAQDTSLTNNPSKLPALAPFSRTAKMLLDRHGNILRCTDNNQGNPPAGLALTMCETYGDFLSMAAFAGKKWQDYRNVEARFSFAPASNMEQKLTSGPAKFREVALDMRLTISPDGYIRDCKVVKATGPNAKGDPCANMTDGGQAFQAFDSNQGNQEIAMVFDIIGY